MKDNKTIGDVKWLLSKVRYASIYNLQPHYKNTYPKKRTAQTLNSSLSWPNRILYRMENEGIVDKLPIRHFPVSTPHKRWNTFFKLTSEKTEIDYNMLEHQSGMRDILIAFLKLYPYYDITIIEQPVYKNGISSYRPDAEIKMRHVNTNEEYTFILEFENDRKPGDIDKNKFKKLQNFKFDHNTKILFVFAGIAFNVFTRPMQYQDPITDTRVNSVRASLSTLWDYMTKNDYDNRNWLLMAFPDFYRLNEAVWFSPDGKKVKLIQ